MDNGLAGQQSIGQTDGKPSWFFRINPALRDDIVIVIISGLMLASWVVGLYFERENGWPGVGLDDGWIHLTFARNLVQHHLWSINPTGLSGGSTSILWVLVLAIGYFFTDNGPVIAMVWNGLLLMILGLIVRRVWMNLLKDADKAVLPTILTLACGNLVWYGFTGMEALLALVLGLEAIHLAGNRKTGWAAILVFLGVLTRPEGALIVGAIGLFRREWRVWILLGIAAGAGLLAAGLWNYHLTGTFLPSTLAGRRWIIGAGETVTANPLEIVKNFARLIGIWGYRLSEFTFGQKFFTAMGLPAVVDWGIAIIEMLVTAVGMIVCFKRRSFQFNTLFVWTIFSLVVYAIMLSTRGHGGRYQPMVLVLVMVCFVMGLVWLWAIFQKQQVLRIGVILLAAIPLLSLVTWFSILSQSLVQFDRVHVAAGRWIDENTPKNARVAGFDIGALAYWGNRTVVDLGGLVDPAAGRALYQRTIPEYMEAQKADYLAMVFPYTDPNVYFNDFRLDELERTGMLRPQRMFKFQIPDETYWPGEAARVLANEIRIYRIVWNEKKNKI